MPLRVLIDLVGQRFGRLVVVERKRVHPKRTHWLCRCDCGKESVIWGDQLRRGNTLSCGCLQSERTAAANSKRIKHGHTRHRKSERLKPTKTYQSWKCMLDRCRCRKSPNFHLYGGRGVTVCEQWQGKDGFATFLRDVGERPDGKTIDRIDNDGNYEPGNVKWSTPKEQAANRRKRRQPN